MQLEYERLPTDARGYKIGVAKLCIKHKVNPDYIYQAGIAKKIFKAKPLDAPVARKERCDAGVPRKFTEEGSQGHCAREGS